MQDTAYTGKKKTIAKQILEENPLHVLLEVHKHPNSKLECFEKKQLNLQLLNL